MTNSLRLLAVLLAFSFNDSSLGQAYPVKPVRFIVSTAPGASPTDISARLIARHHEKRIGQSITVENRPGANNTIAPKAVMSI